MGCDIHAVVFAPTWGPQNEAILAFSEPRDYRLFSAMANVRNYTDKVIPVAEPRGLPTWLNANVDSDGEPSVWVSGYVGFGDHSYSWLTTDEFAEAIRRADASRPESPPCNVTYHAVLAAMRSLDAAGHPATLVFGFDN